MHLKASYMISPSLLGSSCFPQWRTVTLESVRRMSLTATDKGSAGASLLFFSSICTNYPYATKSTRPVFSSVNVLRGLYLHM
mmetsp:Transcript_48037/g.79904  ORF Transcript_48037/g.79904 Transcript_48037/m.79904 type:complete len:82 (-) Transcript_48037:25-270(-)